MFEKSEGIILSINPFQEHDLIFKLITPKFGIISLFLKGGQSSRRRGGTPITPLSKIEATFKRGNSTLFSCREVTLIDPFLKLRASFDSLEAALQMLQHLNFHQMEENRGEKLYQLLQCYLNNLPQAKSPSTLCASFKLKLLCHDGLFGPQTSCSHCGEKLAELMLFGGESFCSAHAPVNSESFTLDETEQLMLLAFSRSIAELCSIQIDPSLNKKIDTLFDLAISNAK
jgi:DNA repair protein RecO